MPECYPVADAGFFNDLTMALTRGNRVDTDLQIVSFNYLGRGDFLGRVLHWMEVAVRDFAEFVGLKTPTISRRDKVAAEIVKRLQIHGLSPQVCDAATTSLETLERLETAAHRRSFFRCFNNPTVLKIQRLIQWIAENRPQPAARPFLAMAPEAIPDTQARIEDWSKVLGVVRGVVREVGKDPHAAEQGLRNQEIINLVKDPLINLRNNLKGNGHFRNQPEYVVGGE